MQPDLIVLLIIAIINAFTGYVTWRTRVDVRTVELATNSMKDALVKSTGEASFAAGREEGREESRVDESQTHF